MFLSGHIFKKNINVNKTLKLCGRKMPNRALENVDVDFIFVMLNYWVIDCYENVNVGFSLHPLKSGFSTGTKTSWTIKRPHYSCRWWWVCSIILCLSSTLSLALWKNSHIPSIRSTPLSSGTCSPIFPSF